MIHLFIDTNVYLSFFHLSSDDLEEIHKLAVLIKEEKIKLWVTQQVWDEFYRNRENKVSDAIKKLKEHKIKGLFPQFCKDYEEYDLLQELQKSYSKAHSEILKTITYDAIHSNFKADKKINELFDSAEFIETTVEILDSAKFRVTVGNPPGKDNSLGDAVNWESLLEVIPHEHELHFVADDKDFYSLLDNSQPKQFLLDEWVGEKGSSIFFYRRLSQFFKEHYPDIQLASELEKESEINALASSDNFYRTHVAIKNLAKYEDYSVTQLNQLVEILLNNNQVKWILSDKDVYNFYSQIIGNNTDIIDSENLSKAQALIQKENE